MSVLESDCLLIALKVASSSTAASSYWHWFTTDYLGELMLNCSSLRNCSPSICSLLTHFQIQLKAAWSSNSHCLLLPTLSMSSTCSGIVGNLWIFVSHPSCGSWRQDSCSSLSESFVESDWHTRSTCASQWWWNPHLALPTSDLQRVEQARIENDSQHPWTVRS